MKSMNSTNATNETFSGKPTISKINDTTLPASRPTVLSGANAVHDKKKSTNGKIGLSTTTIKMRRTGIGEYRLKPLLESPRHNQQALANIIRSLETGVSVQCPKCAVLWNRLTPSGVCYDCDSAEQKKRKTFYGS